MERPPTEHFGRAAPAAPRVASYVTSSMRTACISPCWTATSAPSRWIWNRPRVRRFRRTAEKERHSERKFRPPCAAQPWRCSWVRAREPSAWEPKPPWDARRILRLQALKPGRCAVEPAVVRRFPEYHL